GDKGQDGTSVTVTDTTTDGAGNTVIHFSDGKTVTVPKGAKGDKGQDGTSVTVTDTTTDGAGNTVIHFSDG
ncbi:hypothetical protein WL554_14000, partial [Staphylococcus lugdunensis]